MMMDNVYSYLIWAENEMRVRGATALQSAQGCDRPWDKADYLKVAAQALRDADTFAGRAQHVSIFGDDTDYPEDDD